MPTRREALQGLTAAAAAAALPGTARASDPFDEHDATGLAELVRRRRVSPLELLDAAIARLESVDPKINAVPLRHYELARQQIRAGIPAGPFQGVPLLLKDLWIGLAGTITTGGSRAFRDSLATEDSELTRRFRQAGFVIFGKTASPELGLTGTTESLLHGATRNPWDTTRTAGGSSGGAAAVVAARVIPIAHASDGGGSIRTPASCCGVFGLKPTRARVPMGPQRLEGWSGLSTQLAVSLSVRDMAALLDAVAGPETGSPYEAPRGPASWLSAAHRPPQRLRIALARKPPSGAPVDPECIAAVNAAATLCEKLGHVVEEAAPEVDSGALNAAFGSVLAANTWRALRDRGRERGRDVTEDEVEMVTWRLAQWGKTVDAAAMIDARAAFDNAGRQVALFMRDHDVVLSPTLARPPVGIGLLSLSPADYDAYLRDITGFGPFTALQNFTGQPSMSVPLHWSAGGLPIGTMFSARNGDEATLLALASELERARPWRMKKPPVCAGG